MQVTWRPLPQLHCNLYSTPLLPCCNLYFYIDTRLHCQCIILPRAPTCSQVPLSYNSNFTVFRIPTASAASPTHKTLGTTIPLQELCFTTSSSSGDCSIYSYTLKTRAAMTTTEEMIKGLGPLHILFLLAVSGLALVKHIAAESTVLCPSRSDSLQLLVLGLTFTLSCSFGATPARTRHTGSRSPPLQRRHPQMSPLQKASSTPEVWAGGTQRRLRLCR